MEYHYLDPSRHHSVRRADGCDGGYSGGSDGVVSESEKAREGFRRFRMILSPAARLRGRPLQYTPHHHGRQGGAGTQHDDIPPSKHDIINLRNKFGG